MLNKEFRKSVCFTAAVRSICNISTEIVTNTYLKHLQVLYDPPVVTHTCIRASENATNSDWNTLPECVTVCVHLVMTDKITLMKIGETFCGIVEVVASKISIISTIKSMLIMWCLKIQNQSILESFAWSIIVDVSNVNSPPGMQLMLDSLLKLMQAHIHVAREFRLYMDFHDADGSITA